MKKAFILFIIFFQYVIAFSQAPVSDNSAKSDLNQNVNALLLESTNNKTLEINQVNYWQAQVNGDKQNQKAWMNLFKSTLYQLYPDRSRNLTKEAKEKLKSLLDEMKQNVPDSYAYHYANYLVLGKTNEGFSALARAYALDQQPEFFDDMLAKAIIENNQNDIKLFSKKVKELGNYSSTTFEYNQNVLASLEKNAVLFTYGSSDTYPLIVLQEQLNQRRDIKIINLGWLTHPTYAKEVYSLLGLESPSVLNVTEEEHLSRLTTSRNNLPIYFALTLSENSYLPYKGRLFCTGLAFKYSELNLLNVKVLEDNWKNFNTKYIYSGEEITKNYQLPLAILLKWSENEKIRAEVKETLEKLSAKFPNSTIQKYR